MTPDRILGQLDKMVATITEPGAARLPATAGTPAFRYGHGCGSCPARRRPDGPCDSLR